MAVPQDSLLSPEVAKKIRLIELSTSRLVDTLLSGNYRAHFKGHGMQFSEHRVYVPGDDVRRLDWKASARTKEPLIKKYEEERELSVFIMIDVSGSKDFGAVGDRKSEITAQVAGLLAAAASRTGDRVGAMFFSDRVEKVLPPKRGKTQTLKILRDIMTLRPKGRGTRLDGALASAHQILKQGGIVFILSDFLTMFPYELELKRLARKHDLTALRIFDEREAIMPDVGLLRMEDPESGQTALVDTSSLKFRKFVEERHWSAEQEWSSVLKGSRAERVDLVTHADVLDEVVKFFRRRRRWS